MSCVAHPELAVYADGRIVTFGQSPSQFTVRRYDAVAIRSVIQRLSAVAGSTAPPTTTAVPGPNVAVCPSDLGDEWIAVRGGPSRSFSCADDPVSSASIRHLLDELTSNNLPGETGVAVTAGFARYAIEVRGLRTDGAMTSLAWKGSEIANAVGRSSCA